MNFITTGAIFQSAKTIRAALAQDRKTFPPQHPYANLSASELRGLVAAMVD